MKNHAIVNLVFRKSLVFLCAALVFVSCKKDEDDDPTPPAESQDILFKVDLIKMTALAVSDAESDALEVYGVVNVKLIRDNVTEENELWSADADEYISVGLSDYPMSSSVTFTVAPENISESNIEVISSLNEYDFAPDNPDEDLGTETISTPLSAVSSTSTFQMVLNDYSQQQVQVTYSITRL
jgi:hypothetical protein